MCGGERGGRGGDDGLMGANQDAAAVSSCSSGNGLAAMLQCWQCGEREKIAA